MVLLVAAVFLQWYAATPAGNAVAGGAARSDDNLPRITSRDNEANLAIEEAVPTVTEPVEDGVLGEAEPPAPRAALPSDFGEQLAAIDADAREAAAAVGVSGWNDDAFHVALERLQNDAGFRLALQNEFLDETDPSRLLALSQLLGDAAMPELTAVAESMLHTGNPAARAGAIDLLRRQQAIDPRVRDIALDLMSATSDSDELVAAMNILAAPAAASVEQQQAIINQVSVLTSNPSPKVRRQSYAILGRWVEDDGAAELFAAGLRDEDPEVSRSVAYALVDYPYDNPALKAELWSIVENPDSEREAVSSALLAYESMPLDAVEREQAEAARRALNQR
ncbi:MAG: hypothetical protein CSA54_03095 [Gammaproteobacteria bacterium]|nr:MAG: hypothetical protein CSA54_03095 [Gammaproteobacteria bacterium]